MRVWQENQRVRQIIVVILARCTGTGVLSTMELAEKPEKQLCVCRCQSGTQKREFVTSVEAAAVCLAGSLRLSW